MSEKEKLGASFSKAVGGKLKLKGVEFKGYIYKICAHLFGMVSDFCWSCRKKMIVKNKEKAEEKSEEAAAAHRVSNLQVHQCQKVSRFFGLQRKLPISSMTSNFWFLQHYRIISTPDGNQTVAMKSSSREADLDNRVKSKSDRFCMHT